MPWIDDMRSLSDAIAHMQQDRSRISPRAPTPQLENDDVRQERSRQNILNDPFIQQWLEYRRRYDETPAPYGNPNLKGPLPGPGAAPADAEPYEDPWTGPTLAPKRR